MNVPTTVSNLAKLRAILHYHGILPLGTKDDLVLNVLALRKGETSNIFFHIETQIKDLVKIINDLISIERNLDVTHHIYYKRKHATAKMSTDNVISTPENLDWTKLFQPLLKYLSEQHLKKQQQDDCSTTGIRPFTTTVKSQDLIKTQITQVGAKVKIRWTSEEIGDSGWRPGWYIAHVQEYDESSDTISVMYPSEPNCLLMCQTFCVLVNSN